MNGSTHFQWRDLAELLILAICVACIARTLIFEELFRELRDLCRTRADTCPHLLQRKFFYLFTCEYCFSHYVTALFIALTRFKLLFDDWRGCVVSFFSLVYVANVYLNIYARVRVEIHKEKAVIKSIEKQNHGDTAASSDYEH